MALHASAANLSISKAVDFLCSSQLEYGEFKTYAWSDAHHSEKGYFDSSPFVTSLVLYSLSYVKDDRVKSIADKALDFLCSEMEGKGLWRYWTSRNELHTLLPPDLDSTCCASYILKQCQRAIPANHALIMANRKGDGTFFTWLAVRKDSPAALVGEIETLVSARMSLVWAFTRVLDNVDCAVNANVLLYLGESAETRDALEYLIKGVMQEETAPCTQFYLDHLSFYYMLSRAYAHGVSALGVTQERILERVLSTQAGDGSCGNELLTALAACTLLNFGQRGIALARAIDYLLRTQQGDGSWRRIAMFSGREPYYGSEALTTGLCVEAIARWL